MPQSLALTPTTILLRHLLWLASPQGFLDIEVPAWQRIILAYFFLLSRSLVSFRRLWIPTSLAKIPRYSNCHTIFTSVHNITTYTKRSSMKNHITYYRKEILHAKLLYDEHSLQAMPRPGTARTMAKRPLTGLIYTSIGIHPTNKPSKTPR